MNKKKIILASGSPRRRDMLKDAGVVFDVIASPADEIHDLAMPLHLLCETNAALKAEAVAIENPDDLVIGADTLVYIDQTPLGKPKSEAEAVEALKRLSGRKHQVCTGVCLAQDGELDRFHVITEVLFKELDDDVIQQYMAKVNVMDKAGSYAVQEHGDLIVEDVIGDYNNVVGIPMSALMAKLEPFL